MKFEELLAAFCKSDVKSHLKTQARNGLSLYLEAKKFTTKSNVPDDFGTANIGLTIREHNAILELQKAGKPKGTIDNYVSGVVALVKFHHRMATNDGLPASFSEALRFLIAKYLENKPRGRLRGLGRESGIGDDRLRDWSTGQTTPSEKSLSQLPQLEKLLGVSPGVLEGKLTGLRIGCKKLIGATKKLTKVGEKQRRLRDEGTYEYRIDKGEWPERAKLEWDKFIAFRTGVDQIAEVETSRKGFRSSTEDKVLKTIERFYGFCVNHAGDARRVSVADLSMSLFLEIELFKDYVAFLKKRAGGVETTTISLAIATFNSFLNENTGFVANWPIAWKNFLPRGYKATTWKEKSEKATAFYRRKNRTTKFSSPRAPADTVLKEIIELQHPIQVLYDMLDKMIAELGSGPHRTSASHRLIRNIAIVALLTSNPVRVKNLSELRYSANGKNKNDYCIYQKEGGGWHIFIHKRFMKNEEGAAKNSDYDMPVNDWVFPYLNAYIEIRSELNRKSPYFIVVTTSQSRRGNPMSNIAITYLSALITELSYRHIGQPLLDQGFGPHAFRSIVATEIVKNMPGKGIAFAAAVLHDTVATTEKHYGHYRPKDHIMFAYAYLNEYRAEKVEEAIGSPKVINIVDDLKRQVEELKTELSKSRRGSKQPA
jgi:integrase